jgi:dipicolinate synthase subunit A
VTQDGLVRWDELTIAVLGGDEREPVISGLAAETGAEVRGFGFPWPDEETPSGVTRARSAEDAVQDANYLLLPVPGLHADGSLFAEGTDEPIIPTETLLSKLAPGAQIFGTADESVRELAGKLGIPIHDYPSDEELMRLRAPAIVEGAIALAVQNTVRTLHASEVAVVGFGNIGRQLAQILIAVGASVYVAARNPAQRAAAYALGARPIPLDELSDIAHGLVAIFSTPPAPVIDRALLARLPKDALVMDIAAPPGSVDWDAAKELGVRAIWARGLGRRAPVTVGNSQWYGIRQRIEAENAGRTAT